MSKTMKVVVRKLDTITPYERNAKLHSPEQVAKIARAIKEFGWTQPIVVDAEGVIIAGHGRRLAAIELGLSEVPVVVRDDLSPEQVKAARLADNQVAGDDYDWSLVNQELSALIDANFDIEVMGFDDEELTRLLATEMDFEDGADPAAKSKEKPAAGEGGEADKPERVVKEVEFTPGFQVLVECDDENDQQAIYERMVGEGRKCRVMSI